MEKEFQVCNVEKYPTRSASWWKVIAAITMIVSVTSFIVAAAALALVLVQMRPVDDVTNGNISRREAVQVSYTQAAETLQQTKQKLKNVS